LTASDKLIVGNQRIASSPLRGFLAMTGLDKFVKQVLV
jgi:hypothetical protein